MATFYGGREIDEIIELRDIGATNEEPVNKVIYTVPPGYQAYIQFRGNLGSINNLSYRIYDPQLDVSGTIVFGHDGLSESVTVTSILSNDTSDINAPRLSQAQPEMPFPEADGRSWADRAQGSVDYNLPIDGLYNEGCQILISGGNSSTSQRYAIAFRITLFKKP